MIVLKSKFLYCMKNVSTDRPKFHTHTHTHPPPPPLLSINSLARINIVIMKTIKVKQIILSICFEVPFLQSIMKMHLRLVN